MQTIVINNEACTISTIDSCGELSGQYTCVEQVNEQGAIVSNKEGKCLLTWGNIKQGRNIVEPLLCEFMAKNNGTGEMEVTINTTRKFYLDCNPVILCETKKGNVPVWVVDGTQYTLAQLTDLGYSCDPCVEVVEEVICLCTTFPFVAPAETVVTPQMIIDAFNANPDSAFPDTSIDGATGISDYNVQSEENLSGLSNGVDISTHNTCVWKDCGQTKFKDVPNFEITSTSQTNWQVTIYKCN